MAEYVVTAVVSVVVDKLFSFLTAEWDARMQVCEMRDHLEQLTTRIQCALDTSEMYDINNESLRKWQRELKKVLFAADDIRDLYQNMQEESSLAQITFIERINAIIENYERVTKLKNCVEKLEKTAGDLGNFLFMLERLSKRKMNRKRKRSGVALLGLFFSFLAQTSPEAILCCFGQLPHTRLMELVLHTVFIQSESPVNSSVGFIIVSQNNLAIISVIIT